MSQASAIDDRAPEKVALTMLTGTGGAVPNRLLSSAKASVTISCNAAVNAARASEPVALSTAR